jgi:hypothetical protein
MVEYKGYLIFSKALMVYPDSPYWYSQGDVFTDEPGGSILIKRSVVPSSNPNEPPKPTVGNSADDGLIKSRNVKR